jgi:putative membrane protein insertion efficiency factor
MARSDQNGESADTLSVAAVLSRLFANAPRKAAHVLIRSYQLSLSMLVGRWCRHWPSCSVYTDEAIQQHGLWAGGWMGLARICRCGPGGTSGIDIVCEAVPAGSCWSRPWRYGRWKGVNAPVELSPEEKAAIDELFQRRG